MKEIAGSNPSNIEGPESYSGGPLPIIPRSEKGQRQWSTFRDEPELLKTLIEHEAKQFVESGLVLSRKQLLVQDRGDLVGAIDAYYPGKMLALKVALGIEQRIPRAAPKEKGYWQDFQNVKAAIANFMQTGQELTRKNLEIAGLAGLVLHVRKNFPGCLDELKEKLGMERQVRNAEGRIIWSRLKSEPEKLNNLIEEETGKFIESGESLTHKNLREQEKQDLYGAIKRYYPNGLRGLQEHFGFEVDKRKKKRAVQIQWSKFEENPTERIRVIEQEIAKAITEGIVISIPQLDKAGYGHVRAAIQQYYPGGIKAIKEKFGLRNLSATSILQAYEQALESGLQVSFDEFLRGEK